MIHVIFFAQLREQLGMAAVDVQISDIKTVIDLKRHLSEQNAAWATALSNPNLLVAVNHLYVKDGALLADGDEVAFFPPVTGG